MVSWHQQHNRGFTIVELLIVIVVIAILAAISIVAYSGIQQRAMNSQREQDVRTIAKALELFYLDNGSFPVITNSGSAQGQHWSASNDNSWTLENTNSDGTFQSLASALVPKYISKLPVDPRNTTGNVRGSSAGVYAYQYFSSFSTSYSYCGKGIGQTYILAYRLDSAAQNDTFVGDCLSSPGIGLLGPYTPSSDYRVVK